MTDSAARGASLSKTLLVVDDDRLLCTNVQTFLARELSCEVLVAYTAAEALKIFAERSVDLALLDQRLPDGLGTELCPRLLEFNGQARVIFMTGYPSFGQAVEVLKTGACDYLAKPFELGEIAHAVRRALRSLELERLEQLEDYRRSKERGAVALVGAEGLAETRRLLSLAAGTRSTVLLTGETGTGKTYAAKFLHAQSPRKRGPFVEVNCAAIAESLIESELFGHAEGAFSGASSSRRGVFEMAEGGTLLLDEIGELPYALQAKLLQVLESKTLRRVGSETFRPIDVRLVAATNVDLEARVERGEFRRDLFFRLSVFRVELPPLRERSEDLAELCAFLLTDLSLGADLDLAPGELARLEDYDWPGNVRELRNLLERAAIVRKSSSLRPSRFLRENPTGRVPRGELRASIATPRVLPGEGLQTLEEVERAWIVHTLDTLDWNYTRAAKSLGISRSTLKRKQKAFGLEPPAGAALL